MLDLNQLRREPDAVTAALGRRGVPAGDVAAVVALDIEHRRLLQESEGLRAQVKDLSRQVGEARRAKDEAASAALTEQIGRASCRERV